MLFFEADQSTTIWEISSVAGSQQYSALLWPAIRWFWLLNVECSCLDSWLVHQWPCTLSTFILLYFFFFLFIDLCQDSKFAMCFVRQAICRALGSFCCNTLTLVLVLQTACRPLHCKQQLITNNNIHFAVAAKWCWSSVWCRTYRNVVHSENCSVSMTITIIVP